MNAIKTLVLIGFAQLLAGCSGQIYVMDSDQAAEQYGENKSKTRYVGVPFSPLKEQLQTYYQDRILDKDGKIIKLYTGTEQDKAETACDPVKIQESKIVKDVSADKIRYISYKPGWLESSTFNVELSDGAISKVNSSSTPGVKVTAEALSTIISAARLGFTGESIAPLAPCTSGRLILPE